MDINHNDVRNWMIATAVLCLLYTAVCSILKVDTSIAIYIATGAACAVGVVVSKLDEQRRGGK